jgi:hypothetical protein
VKINLHIERLFLDEALLDSVPATAMREAIEWELTHLLATTNPADVSNYRSKTDKTSPLYPPSAYCLHDRVEAQVAVALVDELIPSIKRAEYLPRSYSEGDKHD